MSLQELVDLPRPNLSSEVKDRLTKGLKERQPRQLSRATTNPSITTSSNGTSIHNGNGNSAKLTRRYFAPLDDKGDWPPELQDYNKRFTDTLEKIKRRHDGVVPTVGMLRLQATPSGQD